MKYFHSRNKFNILRKNNRLPGKCSVNYLAIILFSLFLLASCSNDKQPQEPGKTQPSTYYIVFNVNTPTETGTRSYTDNNQPSNSSDKFETATPNESELSSAEIYICKDDVAVMKFTARKQDILSNTASGNHNITAEIKEEDLEKLTELIGSDVQFLIVANTYETNLNHTFKTGENAKDAKFNLSTSVEDNPIGKFGASGLTMPLINSSECKVTALKNLQVAGNRPEDKLAAVKSLFSVQNHWIIQTIDLERAVARIEFKDSDRETGDLADLDKYIFPIKDLSVKLKLHSLQPFNVNPQSYLFRQTWDGNSNEADRSKNGPTSLLGKEKDNDNDNKKYNWIATPDWTKNGDKWNKNTSDYLNKLTIGEDSYSISGEGKGVVTIDDLKNNFEEEFKGYMPWCYVSENTLPSVDLMKQADNDGNPVVVSYATGVAFKFEVLDTDKKPLVYSSERSKYPAEITNSLNSPEGENWITITDNYNQWIDVKPEKDSQGIYHYYITYVAPIVHNAPAVSSAENLAPMYYGVVRNNTYQMRINSITGIPLPQEPLLYIQLDIRIKQWSIRRNLIDFI